MGRWAGPQPTPLDMRFWAKVDQTGECWTWTAARQRQGYGIILTDGNRSELAHRVSWRLNVGSIPEGSCVLHRCDNPPCVNPAHLFLGTRAENNRDRENKGRGGDHRGEKNGRAKLTREQVAEIRASRGTTPAELAARYGVSVPNIYFVLAGTTWR